MLRAMQQAEFDHWQQLFIDDYAEDLRANSGYSDELARQRAQKSLDDYLPQGLHSARQVLLSIEIAQRLVGYLWFQRDENSIYINDFMLLPAFRGLGYGKQALAELEEQLRKQGVVEIRLRVAADNPRAKRLYEACQFKVTGYNMSRTLNNN